MDLRLHAADLLFDVAVGREDIGIAVQIVIEEEHAERQAQQAGAAHAGARRFIHEQAVAFVVIQAQHLVREVADQQMRAAGAVVIGGIGAHRAARHAVFAERHARLTRLLP